MCKKKIISAKVILKLIIIKTNALLTYS